MQMAPDADPSDGRLDVVRIGDLGRLGLLKTFPSIYSGTHLRHPLNSSARAASVAFELDGPLPCMIDGEIVTLRLQRLDVLPSALEVLA
jgi:diacylglycerol kinase (ATP)